MKTIFLPIVLFAATLATPRQTSDKSVVRLDPALDALVSPDASSSWCARFRIHRGRHLVPQGRSAICFQRHPANVILQDVARRQGPRGACRAPAGRDRIPGAGVLSRQRQGSKDPKYEEYPMIGANGLALDRQGRLVIATWAAPLDRPHREERQAHLLLATAGTQALRGTNDVVVKRDRRDLFSPHLRGIAAAREGPAKELDFNAVYMWKDGKLSLLIKDHPQHQRLAFSPTRRSSYVNGSRDRYVKRYDVKADGTLENGRMLIDVNSDPARGHHRRAAGPTSRATCGDRAGGVWIITPEGKHIAPSGRRSSPPMSSSRPRPQDALRRGAHRHKNKIRLNVEGIPAGL